MASENNIDAAIAGMAQRAAAARSALAQSDDKMRSAAISAAADLIKARSDAILAANSVELDAARAGGQSEAFLDRMTLTAPRIDALAAALRDIAAQPDPLGRVLWRTERPNGLVIERIAAPIGLIAMIYESRPNVTADAAAICVKSGNAIILRGGSDCLATNRALFECMRDGMSAAGLDPQAMQFVDTPDRAAVGALLAGAGGLIDLVIPRGGKSLVARVQKEARAPVLSHLDGICHVYVDGAADAEKARAIVLNAKMRRPGICGAAETLLIDNATPASLARSILENLIDAGCELRGDDAARRLDPRIAPASAEDWDTEYLAPILSVAMVDGVSGAIAHIARHSSGHTESIVTEDCAAAQKFLSDIDSAIVMHNASTQFADGGEFGLGAEIGIATGRLHARGPVGAAELTTYKNVVRGDGQIRP